MRLPSAVVAVALLLVTASSIDAKPRRAPARRLRATATAYCQQGQTKDGTRVHPGVIAADPRVLPLGSVVHVLVEDVGLEGVYTVNDTGGLVKGRHVDIYMPSCARAKRFGRRTATVRVVSQPPL